MTELMVVLGRTNRTRFRDQVLRPLLHAGWIEMTIPDKPTSGRQRYRLTPLGRELRLVLEERARAREASGSGPRGAE